MNERFVNVFVNGLINYIDHLKRLHADVGTPYLVENKQPLVHDITGIIGVSGHHKGCVYFTAPRNFLRKVAASQGDANIDDDNLLDLCGEIANTIAGNARAEFGKQFMISVPMVVDGMPKSLHLPQNARSYAIPISCSQDSPALIVCLEKSEDL